MSDHKIYIETREKFSYTKLSIKPIYRKRKTKQNKTKNNVSKSVFRENIDYLFWIIFLQKKKIKIDRYKHNQLPNKITHSLYSCWSSYSSEFKSTSRTVLYALGTFGYLFRPCIFDFFLQTKH